MHHAMIAIVAGVLSTLALVPWHTPDQQSPPNCAVGVVPAPDGSIFSPLLNFEVISGLWLQAFTVQFVITRA